MIIYCAGGKVKMAKDYQQLLEELHTGQIEEFEIDTDEFMEFQKILMNFNYRKNVVGTAKRGGGARYHYERSE